MKKMRGLFGAAALLVLSIALAGCEVMYAGTHTAHHIKGSYQYFDGTKETAINAKAGQVYVFDYSSKVKKGELKLALTDSSGRNVLEFEPGEKGKREWKAEQDGTYRLRIEGSKTKGSFDFSW